MSASLRDLYIINLFFISNGYCSNEGPENQGGLSGLAVYRFSSASHPDEVQLAEESRRQFVFGWMKSIHDPSHSTRHFRQMKNQKRKDSSGRAPSSPAMLTMPPMATAALVLGVQVLVRRPSTAHVRRRSKIPSDELRVLEICGYWDTGQNDAKKS